jgi:hypothetical protein
MVAGPNPARPTKLWAKISLPGDNKRDRRGIAHLDARTKLGRIHKCFKQALWQHFNNEPNIIEQAIIHRCAMLHTKCLMLDEKLANDGDLNEMETNHYIAWTNALQRSLLRLRIRDLDELNRMRANTNWTRSLR